MKNVKDKVKNDDKHKSTMLSSGGYGCVYYPSISCQGKTGISKKKVTKIQVDDESALNEIEIGTIIKKIPMYKQYFVPIQSSCPINITKLNKDTVESCDILQKQNKQFILMDMSYIKGKNLDDYLLEHSNIQYVINTIISTYTYLLHSLEILNTHNIIHYDLKGNNIMFHANKNIPLIIDFGMSIDLEKLNFDNINFYFFTYAPSYYIWCPEIHIINYLLHVNKSFTKSSLQKICYEITNGNKALVDLLSNTFLDNYVDTMYRYYSKYINKDYKFVIQELLQYSYTWDNYSLSNIYLKIIRNLFPDTFNNNQFIIRFSQLLLKNVHPNPKKRYTLSKSLTTFEDIITTSKKHNFKNVLDSLMKHKKKFNQEMKTISEHMEKLSDTIMKSR